MEMTRRIRGFLPALPLIIIGFSTAAYAGPGCVTIFLDKYPATQTYANGGCQACHQAATGGSTFNVYGIDLRNNGAAGAGFNCAAGNFLAALGAVEGMDSDGEGNSNLVEITAGTQPGWCEEAPGSGCANGPGVPPNVQLDPASANNIPVADAGGPYSGEAGTTLIQFDGSASNDLDNDPLTYAWDFGDGNGAAGMMPTHTYASAGNFTVSLVVNDGFADSEPSVTSAAISAPVANLAPVADPGGPYSGRPGVAVVFDGSGSSDPNGDALSYAWDFGDGAIGDGQSPSHLYAAEGVYTVTLEVSDGQLTSVIASTTAEIATPPANRAPTADPGGPYPGNTGVAVSFDGSGSSDPDGDALAYRWDFGDGQTSDAAMPAHVYVAAGTYTVTLTVNDGEFDSAEATTVAEITDPGEQSAGELLYAGNCLACHGDPWDGQAVDESLPGQRRVAGARSCNIDGSIFGTSVFPNGVPDMQFLQGLSEPEIGALAEYLNSQDTSGERRYVTACAGCHGNDGSGGPSGEGVHNESAGETREAIGEVRAMGYLSCMPRSDIEMIVDFLGGDGTGLGSDEHEESDGGGSTDLPFILWLGLLAATARYRQSGIRQRS